MANTLTGLIPTLYNSLDVVSRELVGFIPSVTSDMTHERAAVGQRVLSPVAPEATASDITPGVTPPDDGDQDIGNVPMEITKSRRVPIRWNGEERLGVDNNGAQYNIILRDQFSQAMRALTNEVEADLAGLHINASRAYGTAGTTPFAASHEETAFLRKLLVDNGTPDGDLQMVLDTSAGAKMRSLVNLSRVDASGTAGTLRQGVLFDLNGFAIRESAAIRQFAAGAGAGATTDATGYAEGETAITLAAAGAGDIKAGDGITFAGDPNIYIVAVGAAAVSGATITLAAPGLVQAIPTAATAVTVEANSVRSMGFARSAMALATRAPALPENGDLAIDRTTVTDAASGLSFEVSIYPQYRQMQYEVALAWGVAAVKPEHMGVLLG